MDKKRDERKVSRAIFTVSGIDCTTCALAIEKQVEKVEGVRNVGTAVMLNKIFIDYDASRVQVSEIMKVIDKAGYSIYLVRNEDK